MNTISVTPHLIPLLNNFQKERAMVGFFLPVKDHHDQEKI